MNIRKINNGSKATRPNTTITRALNPLFRRERYRLVVFSHPPSPSPHLDNHYPFLKSLFSEMSPPAGLDFSRRLPAGGFQSFSRRFPTGISGTTGTKGDARDKTTQAQGRMTGWGTRPRYAKHLTPRARYVRAHSVDCAL